MRILIVAMYFPPTGGAGVHRPLKLGEHLADLGNEVHVLTADDAKWLFTDPSLRVPDSLTVHRVKNRGPRVHYREELVGKGLAETLGTRATIQLRRVLVPDASVIWSLAAAREATRLVRRLGIDVVITTSPPVSVHLAGLAAQRRTGVRWVADLRDSFVSPDRRRHVRGERRLQRLVAKRADAITAATDGFAAEMRALAPRGPVEVIENGSDFEDFEGIEYTPGTRFRLTHTGTIGSIRRDAKPFLTALARTDGDIVARFVGGMRAVDAPLVAELGLEDRIERIPFRPHEEVVRLQRDSEALLMVLPGVAPARKIQSAKIFEYLAADRPVLALVPPDGEAAGLIRRLGAGIVVAPDDVDGIAAALRELERRWREGTLRPPGLSEAEKAQLSRRERAERLAALLERIA